MRGLRGKRVRMVKQGTLIATVDIAATTNTGYCTAADDRDIKVFKFGNTKEGFEKFWHFRTGVVGYFVLSYSTDNHGRLNSEKHSYY